VLNCTQKIFSSSTGLFGGGGGGGKGGMPSPVIYQFLIPTAREIIGPFLTSFTYAQFRRKQHTQYPPNHFTELDHDNQWLPDMEDLLS